ncbi:MAG: TIGR01777 family oxidoreductase [Pseudomonadota bacterium]
MNILITGGTGFIGTALVPALLAQQHDVTVLTRDVKGADRHFQGKVSCVDTLASVADPEVIINLAGESIAGGRWTQERQKALLDSRIDTTQQLLDAIPNFSVKPKLLLSASAVGYYGHSDNLSLTEQSQSQTDGFDVELCKAWEAKALEAEVIGLRVCLLRIGIVLEQGGGALQPMLMPFRLGLGVRLGTGRQWMSWIHLQDVIGIIQHSITNENISGADKCYRPESSH